MPPPSPGRFRRSTPRRSTRRSTGTAPSVALAGAGYIAVVHALAAQSAGMTVRSVASRGGASARHLAGELDARKVTPEALPDGADIMIVAAPPQFHVPLALQGLDAGALVLVEKPLATTLAGADRLVQAVTDRSGVLRCAENLLHAPIWQRAMELRPALGTLGHLSLRTLQPPPDWGHFREPLTFGGVLFDLGPHALALALGLAAETVIGVRAALGSARDDGADDDARVELRFESGLIATIEVSWVSDHTVWEAQAASALGVLRMELLPEVRLEFSGEPVEVPLRHTGVEPMLEQFGYVDQLLDLVARDPNRPGQRVEAARDVLEVICAAYASAASAHDGVGDGLGDEVTVPTAFDRTRTPMSLWRG